MESVTLPWEASAAVRSRGGFVLVAALTVDSIGNGLFAPLSLVYFVRLTDVPLPLVGVLLTVANLVALPLPVWAGALADRFGPRPPGGGGRGRDGAGLPRVRRA